MNVAKHGPARVGYLDNRLVKYIRTDKKRPLPFAPFVFLAAAPTLARLLFHPDDRHGQAPAVAAMSITSKSESPASAVLSAILSRADSWRS